MKYKHRALIAALAVGLMACSVKKDWIATTGSRADGTVNLSYQYNIFQSPDVSTEQGLGVANARCIAWGYQAATPFGGVTQTCAAWSRSGCTAYRVTSVWQCVGAPSRGR